MMKAEDVENFEELLSDAENWFDYRMGYGLCCWNKGALLLVQRKYVLHGKASAATREDSKMVSED